MSASEKPCIRGTRIWVSLIVDNLAEGVSEAELLEAYPHLTLEDQGGACLRCRDDERACHPMAGRARRAVKFKLDENFDRKLRPPRPVLCLIRHTSVAALPTLKASVLRGALWIVEPGRMRAYDPDRD